MIPHVHAEGAYGITNAIPGLPFARERGTANLSYLLYVTEFSQALRVRGAEAYIRGARRCRRRSSSASPARFPPAPSRPT